MSDKGKILVVDDDRLVLATLTHGLLQAGYEVIDTDNGDDAILLAREHRPDLALLDIRMEGKSGFDVAAVLRQSLQMPFMFLSAFADDDTVAQVKALGAVDYLVKPLEVKQILPAVEAALHKLRNRPPVPSAAPAPPGLDDIATAVGLLMASHGLERARARERLERLAHEEGQSQATLAGRLIDAADFLARAGRG